MPEETLDDIERKSERRNKLELNKQRKKYLRFLSEAEKAIKLKTKKQQKLFWMVREYVKRTAWLPTSYHDMIFDQLHKANLDFERFEDMLLEDELSGMVDMEYHGDSRNHF